MVGGLCVVGAMSACGTGSPTAAPSSGVTSPSWSAIARTTDPRELVIDMPQSTSDPADPCWVGYRATVVGTDAARIRIRVGVTTPVTATPCPANAVAGPFYVGVHLTVDYGGQELVDDATGLTHPPDPEPVDLRTLARPPS